MKTAALFSSFLVSIILASAQIIPKSYPCHRTNDPLAIDGILHDTDWEDAPWSDDFVDIEGDKKPGPRFRTRVKMLWDEQNFYIAAEMEEPHMWATILKRDSVIFRDNDFEVFLDPDGDNHQYGELEINALNTPWDLFLPKPYKDHGYPLDCWEIVGLQTAVNIKGTLNNPADTDTGWTLEIALPWRSLEMCSHLAGPPKPGDWWRINFSRVEWEIEISEGRYRKIPNRSEDNWVWSPQGIINMHHPNMWGYVNFVVNDESYGAPVSNMFIALAETRLRIYDAQQGFFEQNSRWANNLDELNVQIPSDQRILFSAKPSGWIAEVGYVNVLELPVKLWIRDDFKMWTEPIHLNVRQ